MAKNTSFVIGEEQEMKLAPLRAALIKNETSGASTPFDFEASIARKRADDAPRP